MTGIKRMAAGIFLAMSIAAAGGNAVIAKPAEDTPSIAIEIAALAKESGFPDGIFNVLLGFGAEAGSALSGHAEIHGVAFCGSSATGSKIMASASANLVPDLSLELGGKCPCLVLPDGDALAAARDIAGGLVYNAGQSCVARSRLIIPRSRLGEVVEAIQKRLAGVTLGHCLSGADMGPLINRKQLDKVLAYIEAGKREEIFGPVLSIVCYDGDGSEGIRIANDTEFGLAAELWTADPARAHGAARRINASHITINGSGGFGIEVPFGGIGKSGFGREGGLEGLLQYTRVKSVYMGIS